MYIELITDQQTVERASSGLKSYLDNLIPFDYKGKVPFHDKDTQNIVAGKILAVNKIILLVFEER